MTPEQFKKKRYEDWQAKNFAHFLKEYEGFDEVARKGSHEDYLTIGHGHYGPDVKRGQRITKEEADALLRQDVRERMPKIKKLIPKFDTFPIKAQIALFGEYYRGSLGGSPETVKHINKGEFNEAAVEFLNNEEYKNRVKLNRAGIGPRMETVSYYLREMGK